MCDWPLANPALFCYKTAVMEPALQTLFLPFENENLPLKGVSGGPALFLGAQDHPALATLRPDCWQPWKPHAAPLMRAGLRLAGGGPVDGASLRDGAAGYSGADPVAEGRTIDTYGLVLALLPKQVDEAKAMLATALRALKAGGVLAAAAANDANGARIEKWLRETGMEDIVSLTKNRVRCVWGVRPETLPPQIESWREKSFPRLHDFGDGIQLKTMCGLFSWDRIDAGSALLARYLPEAACVQAADFGAGIGYLSRMLLGRASAPRDLYVIEADARALACARDNLSGIQEETALHFLWEDLTSPVAGLPPLDLVVMNPPFHKGKGEDAGIGRQFIRTAGVHLKKGGKLLMVANRHLPYEEELRRGFKDVQILAQESGFKIIGAVK
ncbi:MAG: methyltransferase [Micavibrio sp.]